MDSKSINFFKFRQHYSWTEIINRGKLKSLSSETKIIWIANQFISLMSSALFVDRKRKSRCNNSQGGLFTIK